MVDTRMSPTTSSKRRKRMSGDENSVTVRMISRNIEELSRSVNCVSFVVQNVSSIAVLALLLRCTTNVFAAPASAPESSNLSVNLESSNILSAK